MNENENANNADATEKAAATPPATPASEPAAASSNDERMWAMFAHLSALLGFVVPFGSLLGPLVIWQIKKNEMPLVDDQGKEALNFQITMAIAFIVSCILIFVVIGIFLIFLVGLFDLIMTVIAAIRANNGERFRYPLTLRLIQ